VSQCPGARSRAVRLRKKTNPRVSQGPWRGCGCALCQFRLGQGEGCGAEKGGGGIPGALLTLRRTLTTARLPDRKSQNRVSLLNRPTDTDDLEVLRTIECLATAGRANRSHPAAAEEPPNACAEGAAFGWHLLGF